MALCSTVEKAGAWQAIGPPSPFSRGEQTLESWTQSLEARQQAQLNQQHQATVQLLEQFHASQMDRLAQYMKDQKVSVEAALDDLVARLPDGRSSERYQWTSLREAAGPPHAEMPLQRDTKQNASVKDGLAKMGQVVEESNEMLDVSPGELCHVPGGTMRSQSVMLTEKDLGGHLMKAVGWKTETWQDGNMTNFQSEFGRHGLQLGFEPKTPMQRSLVMLINHRWFESISAFLVAFNTVMIGIQIDLDLRRALEGKETVSWEQWCDLAFTSAFAIEILLRLAAEQLYFFTGKNKAWNLFDLFVVSSGLIDLLEVININLTHLRVIRVFRVIRVLRIVRVFRIFRELRMMALSIISCFASLVWAFLLLLLVMYIFSMVLLGGARDYMRDDREASQESFVRTRIEKDFFGVVQTLYTLLQAVSGGNSWGDVARPFVTIGWVYGVMFTVFVIFVMFGLLNVLIGVFVQSTNHIAEIDREFVIQQEMERKDSMMNQMRDLFKEVDADKSGTVSWEELKNNIGDDSVKAYFSLLQIEVEEAEGLFHLLDVDESGEVAIEEFIMGCMRLKGAAKSIDLATLLYENKRMHCMLNRFMNKLHETVCDLTTALGFDPAELRTRS